MSNQNNSNSNAASTLVCGLLGIVFVTLKLLGYISWSWWWVTAPFWVPVVVALVIFAIAGIVILWAKSK